MPLEVFSNTQRVTTSKVHGLMKLKARFFFWCRKFLKPTKFFIIPVSHELVHVSYMSSLLKPEKLNWSIHTEPGRIQIRTCVPIQVFKFFLQNTETQKSTLGFQKIGGAAHPTNIGVFNCVPSSRLGWGLQIWEDRGGVSGKLGKERLHSKGKEDLR